MHLNYFEHMCEMTGYVPKTTFWNDFSMAELFGLDDISDTFNRALEEWKSNIVYLTELVMVLNWKIWYWYENYDEYAELYQELWEKADEWALNNLKDDDLSYFLRTVD